MKVKKVLVFPAGTEIAFEIWNALKYSRFLELYGANSIPSHAEFVFERCNESLPFENDPSFIDSLNDLIDTWEIDYVYPAHDSACLTLTKEQQRIHAKVVTSPLKTVELCRSKNKTYEFFKGAPFLPIVYHSINEVEKYPVFIKPSIGQGSVGAIKINSKLELERALEENIEISICEYLQGDEYTVDCFTDRNRVLCACHMRKRERIKNGISVRSSLVPLDNSVRDIAEYINDKLEFNGAWFFQLKENIDGEYKLMEISPRIPGTMGASRNLGINYPLLTLYNMWGNDVEIIDNHVDITLDRAFISRYKTSISYHTVYIDFDDTLYLRKKVNVQMISFLYQCVNKRKSIILLTKHSKNIIESLGELRISDKLFDRIIHIRQGENKASYLTDTDSIYIDDSFSERINIFKTFRIPVFDLDMIESLIDWRM